jgi:hypothetical protein
MVKAKYENYLIDSLLRDEKMKRYQTDPEAWMIERFGESPQALRWSLWPGYENHQWDGTPDPFMTMFSSLAKRQWLGIESATSTGKTWMLPRVIYWFLDCFPNSLVVTTAPKQQQLKAVLWSEIAKCFNKFKKIRPKAEMFSLRILPNGTTRQKGMSADEELQDMWSAIGVVSGVRAGEESATKMQGYHRENMIFVIEEAAGVPASVFTAIKNTCTGDNNIIIAVGNPDATTDALHQFCVLPQVQHVRISGLDHPNVVLGRTVIPGAVTPKSIEQRAAEYGRETNFFKSRVRGIAPEQANDALIRYDWLLSVTPAMLPEGRIYEPIEDAEDSFNALGVDVANSTDGDAACLCWGRKNHITELQEFQCPNANDIAYNVVKDDLWLEEHKKNQYRTGKLKVHKVRGGRIGIDAVGVGVGTVNQFLDLGYEDVKALQGGADKSIIPTVDDETQLGKKKPMYAFKSLRAQMYFLFAQELQKREFSIDIKDKRVLIALFKELVSVRQDNKAGAIQIESKESLKKRLGKSPNLADAAVYWNWMRKQRTPDYSEAPIG